MNSHARLQVLLIELEFPTWRKARHWSYTSQLGMEEGLRASGVECLTLTTPWLSRSQAICAGKRFDQVWVEVVHNDLDDTFLEVVASVAPVRIGMMAEFLDYSSDVYAFAPHLKERRFAVEKRLKYLTHVLAGDEEDARLC